MKDLITEARKLCEKATEGPWNWISDDPEFLTLGTSGAEQEFHVLSSWKCKSCQESGLNCLWPEKQDAAFIARSRTLIPELCDALEKAQAEIPRWIPVTERLPEVDESGDVDVLVHMDDGFIATCTYDRNASYIASDCWLLWRDAGNVTHWMPLPAPPEEGAEHERD